MKLDTEFVRTQFPAFAKKSLAKRAFFDCAAGSYPCAPVVDRLSRFYTERKVQPYAPYKVSQRAGAEMDEARRRIAAMLGVAPDEVSFGPSTTANTYVLSHAFAEALGPGDAIIVTNQDHEANCGPWRRLEHQGVEVREWRMDPDTGHLDPATLVDLLDENVRLVAFTHCSNIVGEVNDVKAIIGMCHAAGAVTAVDGVSYAPHGLPDVGALGADMYFLSTYKTYGPHQGIMVIRRDLAEALPNQGHYFNADTLYKRFTPAGPDHAQIAACAGIADYWDALYDHHFTDELPVLERVAAVNQLMREKEQRVMAPLLDYLSAKNSVRLLGPSGVENRAPTVAIVADKPGVEIAGKLAKRKINTDGGDFYAVRALEGMGVDVDHGVLRLSFVHYTKRAEVDRLIDALDQVL
ncbi:MAG: aminotransferase class V-fold PLP-dependent enzyme [Pseudomonadota bacterium]